MIASCNTSCADSQADAELGSVRLALGLACHTQSLLQHLDMEQLALPANISLKISNLQNELVTGRPLAMQLGLSRRNKHQQLRSEKGQLQVSKVHPEKNLAHSLTHKAPAKKMLAKLRVATEAAETLALSTVQGDSLASFRSSSSLVVGMVILEPPTMEFQLRQLALIESETCFESLSRNFATSLAEQSLPSLTLHSLSVKNPCLERMSLTLPSKSLQDASVTLHSYSLTRDVESLILQSLSLIDANGFQRISFRELSFEDGKLKEIEEILADKLAEGGAETNSFPQHSFVKDQLAAKEDGTNIFSPSFLDGILSLRICLRIFLLCSFQLVCAALFLETVLSKSAFPMRAYRQISLRQLTSEVTFSRPAYSKKSL